MTVHQYGTPIPAFVGQKLKLRKYGESIGFCEAHGGKVAPPVIVPRQTKLKSSNAILELCGKRTGLKDDFVDAIRFPDGEVRELDGIFFFQPLEVLEIPEKAKRAARIAEVAGL